MSTLHPRSPHPFSGYIRTLGRGKKSTRSLDLDEAYDAMRMILAGHVEPEQLGAFLMLLRVKEESPEELAGFTRSIRDALNTPNTELSVDLDWSSYSGKRKQPPWFILSALALSQSGVRILMHGSEGHTESRIYTQSMLNALGIPTATSWDNANAQLNASSFAYLPLSYMCPQLEQLIHLKSLLGLRSPINTLVRMINPCSAPHSISSVFHPAYTALQTHAHQHLSQPHFCVFKGDGGEIEARPEADTKVTVLHDDTISTQSWSRLTPNKPPVHDVLTLSHCTTELTAVWAGAHNEYALHSILQTLSIGVQLLNPALTTEQAQARAHIVWQQRDLSAI
ncbi:MAG: glycosyl transferase family protein [Pseudomonadota bacterium]